MSQRAKLAAWKLWHKQETLCICRCYLYDKQAPSFYPFPKPSPKSLPGLIILSDWKKKGKKGFQACVDYSLDSRDLLSPLRPSLYVSSRSHKRGGQTTMNVLTL